MHAIGLAKPVGPPVPWLTPSLLTRAILKGSGYSPMEHAVDNHKSRRSQQGCGVG